MREVGASSAAVWGQSRDSIHASGRRFGLEVRTEAPVASINVRDGAATGVVLTSGEELHAKIVASNANAKLVFLRMVAREHLSADFISEIESFRTFSTAFKINAACEAPPCYTAFDKAKAGFDYPTYVHIGPSIDISSALMTTPSMVAIRRVRS